MEKKSGVFGQFEMINKRNISLEDYAALSEEEREFLRVGSMVSPELFDITYELLDKFTVSGESAHAFVSDVQDFLNKENSSIEALDLVVTNRKVG